MNKTQKYITTLNEKLAGGLKKGEIFALPATGTLWVDPNWEQPKLMYTCDYGEDHELTDDDPCPLCEAGFPTRPLNVGNQIYPVGFQLQTVGTQNPTDYLGFGTWELIRTTTFTTVWERTE